MKCSRCQQENPPQAKFCLEYGAAVDAPRPPLRSSAETGAEIEALRRSLSEALKEQAARGRRHRRDRIATHRDPSAKGRSRY
jgi:hypothetical protein